jgi:hypothetical protein
MTQTRYLGPAGKRSCVMGGRKQVGLAIFETVCVPLERHVTELVTKE